jgi:hypothetical protein
MATNPMMTRSGPAGYADSQMPDDGMAADDQAGAVEFCIRMAPDGSLTAYSKGQQQKAESQEVGSFGEGLAVLLKLYKAQEQEGNDPDAQLKAGFDAVEQPQPMQARRNTMGAPR